MKKLKSSTIKKLKPYWAKLERLEYEFLKKVDKLEKEMQKEMQKEINIPDLFFYSNDGGYCGIGDQSRTIKLIHEHELKGK